MKRKQENKDEALRRLNCVVGKLDHYIDTNIFNDTEITEMISIAYSSVCIAIKHLQKEIIKNEE